MNDTFFAHHSADVSPNASIGKGTKIWQHCQVREGAIIGQNCILSKGVYVDAGAKIGNNVKIQNGISIYHGVTLEDGVFCGPHCVFTNDKLPRAVNPDGTLKGTEDWEVSESLVKTGASIGANATIVCGHTIGKWAMIGAGAVITRNVPDYGLVVGNPARLVGFVCPCGQKLQSFETDANNSNSVQMICPKCRMSIDIPLSTYSQIKKS